jgi:hypothetical protein
MALAALASLHAATIAGKPTTVAIGGGLGERPSVELSTTGLAVAAIEALEQLHHA